MDKLLRLYIVVRNYINNPHFREYDLDHIARCLGECMPQQAMFIRGLDRMKLCLLHRSVTCTDPGAPEHRQLAIDFLMEAFKELSVMKNPIAMKVFSDLYQILVPPFGPSCLLWACRVNKRKDGSAVVVLHISNLNAFEARVRKPNDTRSLIDGIAS